MCLHKCTRFGSAAVDFGQRMLHIVSAAADYVRVIELKLCAMAHWVKIMASVVRSSTLLCNSTELTSLLQQSHTCLQAIAPMLDACTGCNNSKDYGRSIQSYDACLTYMGTTFMLYLSVNTSL